MYTYFITRPCYELDYCRMNAVATMNFRAVRMQLLIEGGSYYFHTGLLTLSRQQALQHHGFRAKYTFTHYV